MNRLHLLSLEVFFRLYLKPFWCCLYLQRTFIVGGKGMNVGGKPPATSEILRNIRLEKKLCSPLKT